MTEPDDDLDPALGALLRRALRQHVDPDTSQRHLEIIKSEAARLQAERNLPQRRPRRQMLIAALVGLLLMTMSGGAVAASGAALPGDLLYPVKLGTEQVRLLIATSPEADSAVLLDIARRRIAEAQQAVADRPEAVNGLVQEAMIALDAADVKGDPALRRTASTLRDQASKTVALTDDLDPQQADALQTPTPRTTTPSPSAPSTASSPGATGGGASSPAPAPSSPAPTNGSSGNGGATAPSLPPVGAAPPETSTAGVAPPRPTNAPSSSSLRPETSSGGSRGPAAGD